MLVEAEIWTIARTDQGNAVLLRPTGSDAAVPIFIGQLEAQSILIGLGNVPMPRPLTHDLFLSVLGKFGITVERIEITDLKDGTFYSKLILGKNGELIAVDARPSDSIALAVRVKCPVFIAESIIDEAGIPVASISEEPTAQEKNPIEAERKKLKEELEKLVEQENYEEAARIRDLLKELEKNYPET